MFCDDDDDDTETLTFVRCSVSSCLSHSFSLSLPLFLCIQSDMSGIDNYLYNYGEIYTNIYTIEVMYCT